MAAARTGSSDNVIQSGGVLIVGAGVTGSLLALLARDAGLSVRVLEKVGKSTNRG
jgi:2-polyprenyl-6-methoxyphenol hydroxylase-like FAD-dependent oxidoreductase